MNSRVHCGVRTGWIFALLVLFVHGCAGYVPGRQAYWDAQVRQMCEKDGGVQIFEKLHVARSQLQSLGTLNGNISVPSKEVASRHSPAYAETYITYIRRGNPRVSRTEHRIIRRHDAALVAQWVVYSRFGGDFPSPAHESSFSCPDLTNINRDIQPLFVVEEN